MRDELWEFLKVILDELKFANYINLFDSDESFSEIIPVIIELNKMGIREDIIVNDPLQLLVSAMSSYTGESKEFAVSCLTSSAEVSTNLLRSKLGKKVLVGRFKLFEKLLNSYNYSGVLKCSDIKSAKTMLLNCLCNQLFGLSSISFDVDDKNLISMFSKSDITCKEYTVSKIVAVVDNGKTQGYIIFYLNKLKYAFVSLRELNRNNCEVCGCTTFLKGEVIKNGCNLSNGLFVNAISLKDIISDCDIYDGNSCAYLIFLK